MKKWNLIMIVPLIAASACCWADELPTQVDLRFEFEALGLRPKSQGKRSTCSLFAVVGVLEFELARGSKAKPVRLSEDFLNWASHKANGRRRDGSFFADAVRGARIFGVSSNKLMPNGPKYDLKVAPSEAAMTDARQRRDISPRWIKRWNPKTGLTDQEFKAIKLSLAAGHPLAIGMRWPKKGRFLPGNVLTVGEDGKVFDGHSVVLVGYEDRAEQAGGGTLIFRNSSGPKWREAGHARLTYEYVRTYCNDVLGLRVGTGDLMPSNTEAASPIEIEALEVVKATDCEHSTQRMSHWGPQLWSGGKQVFGRGKPGAELAFAFPVEKAGRFRLDVYATRAPDYARIEVKVDGRKTGKQIDTYAEDVEPTGRISLGTMNLDAGQHGLSFRVVGKNRKSTGHCFGIDCIELTKPAGKK